MLQGIILVLVAVGIVYVVKLFFKKTNNPNIQLDTDAEIKALQNTLENSGLVFKKGTFLNNDENNAFLGMSYLSGAGVSKNEYKAFGFYKKAADAGHSESQYIISNMYKNGVGIKKNSDKFFFWLQKSAENGYLEAQNNLGSIFDTGAHRISINKAAAAKWYSLAAEQGDNLAQCNLAVLYLRGDGIKQNIDEGFRLLKLSAASGNEAARQLLFNIAG